MEVLTDEHVARRVTRERAVAWMHQALVAHHRGDLTSPTRVHTRLDGGRLVFTTGALRGAWFGYRSDPPHILAGTPQGRDLRPLGAVVAGAVPGRTSPQQRVLFCSVGLAGTEVFLLARLLEEPADR